MTNAQPQVFISYQRADEAFARLVREHLVTHGVQTWMDQYDIPVGAYWPDAIDEGLNASDIVVGILSPEAMASRNVKNEWDWAIQNDKRLLLLQVTPTAIPHRYVSINFIDATGPDLTPALVQLLETLGVHRQTAASTDIPITRYARSGDVSVAFQTVGDGPVDLVWTPGSFSHLEHMWTYPSFARLYRSIASFSRLILFDKRGTGQSDRVVGISTMEERMDDIRAVMDAVGSERAVIFGVSEGASLGILFAATYPERTISLLLYGGVASNVRRSDYPWNDTYEERLHEIDAAEATIHETWGSIETAEAMTRRLAPSRHNDPHLVRWIGTLMKVSVSPGAEIARRRMNLELDVRHVLPTIRVPTLVIHRTGDRAARIAEGRYIAERIPGAIFVELPGEDHVPTFEDTQLIIDAVEAFVSGDVLTSVAEPDRVLATVLTVNAASNDPSEGPHQLLRLTTPILTRFRGQQITTTTDDHIIASFDGPARAIRCGAMILDVIRAQGSEARAALHTGEMELVGSGGTGVPVRIASELAALADSNEIIVTSTVKDLVAGSGIRFEGRGLKSLAGLSDEWHVYAVDRSSID